MGVAEPKTSNNKGDLDSAFASVGISTTKGGPTNTAGRRSSTSTAVGLPPPAYTAASHVVTKAVAEHSAIAGKRLSAPTDKGSTISSSPNANGSSQA